MQILILAVGKESSKAIFELQQEYQKRLKTHADISWKIVPASRLGEPEQLKDQESQSLLALLKPSDSVILLDERGKQFSNTAFAATFEKLAGTQGRMVIIIGGAYGVSDSLRQRASLVWSLSELVFPHQLVRIMLLEQLYRTFMVMQNHPYHHS